MYNIARKEMTVGEERYRKEITGIRVKVYFTDL